MLSVLPVLSAFANNGKQSIKQICCMIYCLTSLIFIFKQFSSTIDWTQPSPLDATACSGLSISSGNSIPERDAPCQPWSCHVMPKRCSILVQMEITSLQNHPFESNSWRSPSKSPLMVGLTSEYAKILCLRPPSESSGLRLYLKRNCLSQGRCAMCLQSFLHTTQVYQA